MPVSQMNTGPWGVAVAVLVLLTGCHGMSMSPSSSQAGSAVNSFLRPDGSLMYFVQNLEWKSSSTKDRLTLDITLHTSSDRCDSSVCQVSWFSDQTTPPLAPILELPTFSLEGTKMYRKLGKSTTEHRYEFQFPSGDLVQWLEGELASCTFMDQQWNLSKSGSKARSQASLMAFEEWREACPSGSR